jgi:2-dehydropantoate 2-reductase
MNIVIIGCGAMGSIYAGLLAKAGNDVAVVDRGAAHVDAINSQGLRVEGPSGDHVVAIRAFTQVPDGIADLVIVSVKAAHVADVAPRLGTLIGPNSVILTIQNGVGSADQLARHVPAERLAVGIAGGFGAIRRGPGHVYHNAMNIVRMGPFSTLPLASVEAVASLWRQAGFRAEAVEDVQSMQWEKLICNVAYSAPCALTGLTVGEVMDDPEMGPISRAAATEAWTVARALGIAVKTDDPVALVRNFAAGMPAARPSMLQDLEHGRRSEIDVINGAVSRAAAKAGVAVPVNDTLVALVKVRERGF